MFASKDYTKMNIRYNLFLVSVVIAVVYAQDKIKDVYTVLPERSSSPKPTSMPQNERNMKMELMTSQLESRLLHF